MRLNSLDFRGCAVVALGALVLTSCSTTNRDSGEDGDAAVVPDGNAGSGGAGGTAGAGGPGGRWGTGWLDATSGRTPAACEALADALSHELGTAYCTAVFRLAPESLAVVAHTTICAGSSVHPVESAARTQASESVTYPNNSSPAGSGAPVPGSGSDSEWAFYTSASDFGGVTVVSAVTSRTVFGGSIVWGGTGSVLYPETWSTSDIGVGCATPAAPPPTSTLVLLGGTPPTEAIHRAIMGSVYPAVWRTWGAVFTHMTAMKYPRSVGTDVASMDASSEYLVFVEGFTPGG